MITIHKQTFPMQIEFDLMLPRPVSILKIAMQDGRSTMWYLCDSTSAEKWKTFYLYGTGHDIGTMENKRYIETFFDGPFVWHLFEHTQPEEGKT